MRKLAMRNQAMQRKLTSGQAVDISPYRTDFPADGLHAYVLPDELLKDGRDYCDAELERWVWSIGRHRTTAELHASLSARHYGHPQYECVWLR